MNVFENDIASVYSESTIYESEIVARDIEEYERNQRLRIFGLLTDIEEERQIDLIESIRNGDNYDRVGLIENHEEENQEEENSTICLKFNYRTKTFIKFVKTKNFVILFFFTVILASIISLGIFWIIKVKTSLRIANTTERSNSSTSPQENFTTSFPQSSKTSQNESSTEGSTKYLGFSLAKGRCIYVGNVMVSENGCFYLTIQEDGNMVIYRKSDRKALWSTDSVGRNSYEACFQSDGNFVLYTKKHEVVWAPTALWHTYHVVNILNRPDTVYLSDQGQLIFARYGKQKWATPKISEC